jgi:hypothetical protein
VAEQSDEQVAEQAVGRFDTTRNQQPQKAHHLFIAETLAVSTIPCTRRVRMSLRGSRRGCAMIGSRNVWRD